MSGLGWGDGERRIIPAGPFLGMRTHTFTAGDTRSTTGTDVDHSGAHMTVQVASGRDPQFGASEDAHNASLATDGGH